MAMITVLYVNTTCVICKQKFESCLHLNEHYMTAHTQHDNCDKFRTIGYQMLEYYKSVDTHDSVVIPHSNGNTVEDITDKLRPKSYASRYATDEERRLARNEYHRKRRARLTDEQRMDINKKRRDREERNRMDRIRDDQLLEMRTAKESAVCYNDKQILVIKVGKDRAIQLSDDIDNEVKKCVDSGVEYLSGNEYEDKHSVDNDIDFDSIISNVIENIELNGITNTLKQENEDRVNSVCFNADNQQIEIILPTITPKQFISCEKKNNFNLESDLMKRIIRRKLLIELNLKFFKYMCDRMGLRGIESLNTHQMVRHEDIYTCFWPQCKETFKLYQSLTNHIKLNHYRENDILQLNGYNNTDSNESDNKVENTYIIPKHCDQKIYVCCKCDEKFRNVYHLYDHIITHIDKPFMCDFCDNRFDSINELLSHRDYTHFKKNCLCDVCDYKSSSEHRILMHKIRVHEKEKKLICTESECDEKTLTSRDNPELQKHFLCTESDCGKAFTSRNLLGCHKINVHSGKRYECVWPECGASFKKKSYLNDHLRLHSGLNTFRCDFPECNGKIFASKYTLNSHVKYIHNDDKPIACDWPDCCAKFKTTTQLWIHTNSVHNKNRKYKCPHCDYSAYYMLLYQHKKRVHDKVKKFVCDIPECNGKRFHTKQELNDHKNSVHSNKRPFVCDWPQCNKAFKLKHILKSHVKKAH